MLQGGAALGTRSACRARGSGCRGRRHQCAKRTMLQWRAALGTQSACGARGSGRRGRRHLCAKRNMLQGRAALGTRSACRARASGRRGSRSRLRCRGRGFAPHTRRARGLGTASVVQRGAGPQPRVLACLADGALLGVVAPAYTRGPVGHRMLSSGVRAQPQTQRQAHLALPRVVGGGAARFPPAELGAWRPFMEFGKFRDRRA